MNRFVFSAVGIALVTVACGSTGSSGSGGEGSGATNQPATALAYTSPCAPTSCDDKPVADDSGVATCSADSSGTCGWAPGAPGSTPGSTGSGGSPGSPGSDPGTATGSGPGTSGSGDPGGGTTSFAPCDPSACTAIPDIACGPGYQMNPPECGSLNGGACAYIIQCSPIITSDGGTCSPDQCGPELADARVCDGGVTGTKVCISTSAGCQWIDECP